MGRSLCLLMTLALPALADWTTLAAYHDQIPRAEFDRLLRDLYSPDLAITNHLTYGPDTVTLHPTFTLRFTSTPQPTPPPSPIRTICLDPGHIGGEWARMEQRWFQHGRDRPVQEAELNLIVARLLKPRLEQLGFTVTLSKNDFQPVTPQRPEDFRAQAERDVPPSDDLATRADAVRQRMELLFYRHAEIAARARRINTEIKPDLTLAIHFNAVPWDECQSLVADNRLLFFVHGHYLAHELADESQRYRLFYKLLRGTHRTEMAVADAIAAAFQKATGLPPAAYPLPVGTTGYVFARNLAANRLIDSPVVYLEPYYMNNRLVYHRLQLGDYDGKRLVEGQLYPSIFREYADAVATGLAAFTPR